MITCEPPRTLETVAKAQTLLAEFGKDDDSL